MSTLLEDLIEACSKLLDVDCCTGYTFPEKNWPILWDAIDKANNAVQRSKQETTLKVTSIATCYERKFNLETYGGNKYESMKLESTAWADVDEGEDVAVCFAALQLQCRESVRKEFGGYLANLEKQKAAMKAKEEAASKPAS